MGRKLQNLVAVPNFCGRVLTHLTQLFHNEKSCFNLLSLHLGLFRLFDYLDLNLAVSQKNW